MAADDKVHNAAEDALGHVKEGVGRVTDDQDLEAEGQSDQAKAKLKKVGENVKDAFK